MKLLKLCALCLLVGYITAYPSGAPGNICGRYVPGGHRNMGTPVANGPRTGPYSVTVQPDGKGMHTVMINATSSRPFKGFVIQAVPSWKALPDGPSDIIGSFIPVNGLSQEKSCGFATGSNILTHTSSAPKTSASATWRAPANLPDGNVKFVATIVQDFDNFNVIHSAPYNVLDSRSGSNNGMNNGMNSGMNSLFTNSPGGNAGMTTLTNGNILPTAGSLPTIAPFVGGIPVVPDTPPADPVRIELFSPDPFIIDPPPPIVLPNGKLSSHTLDGSSNSGSSSVLTLDSIPNRISDMPLILQASPISETTSTVTTSESQSSFSLEPATVTPVVSDSSITSGSIGATSMSETPLDLSNILDTASSSVTSVDQNSPIASQSSPGDVTVSIETGILSVPSFDEIGMSGLSTVTLDGGNLGSFVTESSGSGISTNPSTVSTNVASGGEPAVRIIEIPILPEGQRAALLNIERGNSDQSERILNRNFPLRLPAPLRVQSGTQGQTNGGQFNFNSGQNRFGQPQGPMFNNQGNSLTGQGQGPTQGPSPSQTGNGNFFNAQRFPSTRFGQQNTLGFNGQTGRGQTPPGPMQTGGMFGGGPQFGTFGQQGRGQGNNGQVFPPTTSTTFGGLQFGQNQFGPQGQFGPPNQFGRPTQFGQQFGQQFRGQFPGFGNGAMNGQFQQFRQFQGMNGPPSTQFRFGQFGPQFGQNQFTTQGQFGGPFGAQQGQFGNQGQTGMQGQPGTGTIGQTGQTGGQGLTGNQGQTGTQQNTGTNIFGLPANGQTFGTNGQTFGTNGQTFGTNGQQNGATTFGTQPFGQNGFNTFT